MRLQGEPRVAAAIATATTAAVAVAPAAAAAGAAVCVPFKAPPAVVPPLLLLFPLFVHQYLLKRIAQQWQLQFGV